MQRVVNWLTKMRCQLRKLIIISCFCFGVSIYTLAQNTPNFKLLNEFDIPRTETIELFQNTSTGSPVILSSKGDVIFIRPINVETGLPIRLLSIRSNDTKKVKEHILRGDSLFCLIKSMEEDQPISYESVIYSLRGDVLSEAHRHQITFEEGPETKTAQRIHFTASNNGKIGLIVRQHAFSKNERASVFIEITRFPSKITRNHTIRLPFDSDDVEITGVSITNKGIVNLAVKTGVKINSPFLRKHMIYSFLPEQKQLHEYDLSLEKHFLKDILIQTINNETHTLALYSQDPFEQAQTDGFVYLEIDTSGTKVKFKNVVPFSDKVISEMQDPSGRQSSHVDHLYPSDFLKLNGNIVALFDQQYIDQVCTTDPRTGIITCTDQYHYDGLLLQSTSAEEESSVIARRQIDYKSKGPYIGHQAFSSKGRIIIFYNDHSKNESAFAERAMNNPSRAAVRYVYTDNNRELQSGMLPILDDYILFSSAPGFENKGSISMLFSDGKNFKVGRINPHEW